jgi:hypothetical protein
MLRLFARTSSASDSGSGVGSRSRARSRPLVSCATVEAARVRLVERERFAATVDRDLRQACRAEAAARLALGTIAGALLRRRGYRRLGFVRFSDYARERLGISARALESAAFVATRLEDLPRISAAFHAGELSWTKVRLLAGIAGAGDEDAWLERARAHPVDALEAAIRGGRAPTDPESDLIDGEPAVTLRIGCPGRLRSLWRHACELASRVAGEPLVAWQAAEVIAAEGIAGRPAGVSVGDRVLVTLIRLGRRRAGPNDPERTHGNDAASPQLGNRATNAPRPAESLAASTDPFEVDRRLLAAIRASRGIEPQIGRLLRLIVDHHLYRSLGFRSLDGYVRERLGISLRKVWALVKVERSIRRATPFAEAYEQGRLSWVRALALLPVVDRSTAPDWIVRANAVTVRRLTDEVNWVLDRRDRQGGEASLAPPPLDCQLVSPVTERPVQIGARGEAGGPWARNVTGRAALEVSDGEIRFTGPASVVALFRDALDCCATAGEPRWSALERLLTRVIADWEAEPSHRDPVFARDGWRCTVPACSSRRNLHDHHVQFRSRGGTNRRANRTTVCAAHHLHGLHAGIVRARGAAPAVHWELGVRTGGPPVLSCIGDRYV